MPRQEHRSERWRWQWPWGQKQSHSTCWVDVEHEGEEGIEGDTWGVGSEQLGKRPGYFLRREDRRMTGGKEADISSMVKNPEKPREGKNVCKVTARDGLYPGQPPD